MVLYRAKRAENMAVGMLEANQNNPNDHQLVAQRRSLGITLSALMGVDVCHLRRVHPVGRVCAGVSRGVADRRGDDDWRPPRIAVIVSAFLLTGYYVSRANAADHSA